MVRQARRLSFLMARRCSLKFVEHVNASRRRKIRAKIGRVAETHLPRLGVVLLRSSPSNGPQRPAASSQDHHAKTFGYRLSLSQFHQGDDSNYTSATTATQLSLVLE